MKTFDTMIFASYSPYWKDYEQMIGRILRGDALKKNLYIHLVVADGVDESCYKRIMEGRDFNDLVNSKYEETRSKLSNTVQ